ncbi:MAG: hypothetical protein M1829_005226 [Trizodia sp. TS-e1964]|nr:MAG: hypothetical protein M1829_005226 [Trizodia sp. TS-e1964]
MLISLQQSWQDKAAAKVAQTKSKICPEWTLTESDLEDAKNQRELSGPFIEKFLESKEQEIIHIDSVSLVAKIKAGQHTALEVALAYCKTAAIAHQIVSPDPQRKMLRLIGTHNYFGFIPIERAKELDDYFTKYATTRGPLHGLPISLKDQFHVNGADTTMGYVGWINTYEGKKDPDKVHRVESQIVKELLSLGAIIYCKTSLPQTLLFGETVNNLIGRTLNPINQLLSCGGSSGGEGALIALRGSSIGVGTDIGGSVRIPAAFCGIYSIKPTHNRFSYRDVANTNPGQNTYPSSVGFLSNSVDALELVMASVLLTQPWLRDPEVVSIPWRIHMADAILDRAAPDGSSNHNTPLKLGIYWSDMVVEPHPPILRGLHTVANTLKNAGHKLAFLKADGAHDIHKQINLSGEPLIPQLRATFQLRDPINLLEYQDLSLQGRDYSQIVDAVIMPVAPHAAVIPGKFYHTAYTESINLLDYSVAVIPVTRASKALDKFDSEYSALNEIDRKNWEAYDPDVYDGAPVGLQIVARKYEEEKVWAIAKVISMALKTAGVQ